MAFSIGIIGAGEFAEQFVPLFQLHPDISDVAIADLIPERREDYAKRFGIERVFASADEMFNSDLDAVGIFTQRWTHGELAVKALRAGKHVYSAVPMAYSTTEIGQIIAEVRRSGLVYMMGETSYYNPAAIYGRQRQQDGGFGRLFYAEGDYVHDMDHGFYTAFQRGGGENWRGTASYPPMHYPTHSLGGVLSVTQDPITSVSCLGVEDDHPDGIFNRELSIFGNSFSNQTALFQTKSGGAVRINEMRRVGYPTHIRESRFRFFGTEAVFEQTARVSAWQTKHTYEDVSDLLQVRPTAQLTAERAAVFAADVKRVFLGGYSPLHDRSRLPQGYDAIPNGHEGSHHFLAADFVEAVITRTMPSVNAWVAARFTVPGILAHDSSLAGGERLMVPDFGDAPV
ncbi:MAG: Gfo/Idh/MocA family oxidoreductase [Bifidobacteriaceae bacterium]|jgi:predicted dehydrogenase|nr:Gfo/Idh/MocA family oxidoreductase [Bifidobacteriaceae bacterium]